MALFVVPIHANFEKHFTDLRKTPGLLPREFQQFLFQVGRYSKSYGGIFSHSVAIV